jgi:hypothetical protein
MEHERAKRAMLAELTMSGSLDRQRVVPVVGYLAAASMQGESPEGSANVWVGGCEGPSLPAYPDPSNILLTVELSGELTVEVSLSVEAASLLSRRLQEAVYGACNRAVREHGTRR